MEIWQLSDSVTVDFCHPLLGSMVTSKYTQLSHLNLRPFIVILDPVDTP